MSEFVKRTMMGYKEVPGGHSDPECTHVILTLKEYDQILQEKRKAEMDATIAKSNADKAVAKAERMRHTRRNRPARRPRKRWRLSRRSWSRKGRRTPTSAP